MEEMNEFVGTNIQVVLHYNFNTICSCMYKYINAVCVAIPILLIDDNWMNYIFTVMTVKT